MSLTLNGNGTVTGLAVGGLPDGSINNGDLATNAVSTSKILNGAVTLAKMGSDEQAGLAKAWVNFNGTGTVAIRASYNVSSITDNGAGDYTVNFTTAMADANYAAVGSAGTAGTNGDSQYFVWLKDADNRSASAVRMVSTQHGVAGEWGPNPADVSQFNVAIFR